MKLIELTQEQTDEALEKAGIDSVRRHQLMDVWLGDDKDAPLWFYTDRNRGASPAEVVKGFMLLLKDAPSDVYYRVIMDMGGEEVSEVFFSKEQWLNLIKPQRKQIKRVQDEANIVNRLRALITQ